MNILFGVLACFLFLYEVTNSEIWLVLTLTDVLVILSYLAYENRKNKIALVLTIPTIFSVLITLVIFLVIKIL